MMELTQTHRTVSVAVVDDDPVVLRGVARLLHLNGIEAATYSSPRTFLAEIDGLRPSCVIVDYAMPELSGLELQQALAALSLDYPLVFITGFGDVRTSVQAMRNGAVDFITKPFTEEQLLDAVRRGVEKSRAARLINDRLTLARNRLASLTLREREVFEEVVEGCLNKQIAAKLGITEKTVKVHRARVMRKMAVRSVAQLARIAEQLANAPMH